MGVLKRFIGEFAHGREENMGSPRSVLLREAPTQALYHPVERSTCVGAHGTMVRITWNHDEYTVPRGNYLWIRYELRGFRGFASSIDTMTPRRRR